MCSNKLLLQKRHAALLGLIIYAYILHTVYYNTVFKFVCNAFTNRALNDSVIKLLLYFII